MESPQSWDRLTASLAVVELRDLEAVWGFLSHSRVIEFDQRGAFQQVVTAVVTELDRGDVTGPSYAARIAFALRGLQTPRGAQLDPDGRHARAEYDAWRITRMARRSRPPIG